MIRTLVVEESSVARLGIRALLGPRADALDIDEAGNCAELTEKLNERYYELIIVEPLMSGIKGADLVKELRTVSPWSDLLVFTELDELTYGIDAIRHGAKGYLMKTATGSEFMAAVKRVGGGRHYFSAALAAELAVVMRRYDVRKKPHESFSTREFQVFSMAVCGMTVVESAHILQIGIDTVRALKQDVMARLQAAAPHELGHYATAQGLTSACRSTCSELWNGRFAQDYEQAPATVRPASQPGSSAAPIGFAIR